MTTNQKPFLLAFLSLAALTLLPTAAAAGASTFENGDAMSTLERVTYISFVAISLVFIAAAFFLFMERNDVARRHRPAIGLGVMIVGIAGFQYALMQDVYLTDGSIPTDFRYSDWLTTVPLMAVTFALLAGKDAFTSHRLFSLPGMSVPGIIIVGSLFMMVGGYIGQVEVDQALAEGVKPSNIHWFFFGQGMVGYLTVFLIVGTPFTGAYGIDDSKITDPAIQLTMTRLRRLILIGWTIYPAGYIIGALEVGGQDGAASMMLVYNIADLVNKLAFVIIVLVGARSTEEAQATPLGFYAGHAPSATTIHDSDDQGASESLLELAALSKELAEAELSGEL
jgi:bacteriorhodopsin